MTSSRPMAADFDRDSWERRWSQALRAGAYAVAQRPPNAHLLAEVADLRPGLALDAGAGHGAETLWLASRGWRVTAVDFSTTALGHARSRASAPTSPRGSSGSRPTSRPGSRRPAATTSWRACTSTSPDRSRRWCGGSPQAWRRAGPCCWWATGPPTRRPGNRPPPPARCRCPRGRARRVRRGQLGGTRRGGPSARGPRQRRGCRGVRPAARMTGPPQRSGPPWPGTE